MKIRNILTLSLIAFSVLGLSGCGGEQEQKHECRLFDVEGKVATCVDEGVIAHKHCIYCNKRFVDGKEIEEYLIPVDANNHVNVEDVSEVLAKCNEAGVKAHKKCNDCGALLLNGAVVNQEALVIPSLNGGHDFTAGTTCKNCDAYKITYDGKDYVCDAETRREFVSNTFAAAHPSGTKTSAFEAGFATRMTFATQGSTAVKVKNNEDGWHITDTVSSVPAQSFTRVALGDASNKPYKGKAIISFDVVMNLDFTMSRFGVRVVDSAASDAYKATQDLLYGNHANEENNASRTVKAGDVYRFTYALETTEDNQFVQFWGCSAGTKLDITLKNLYVFMPGAGEAISPTCSALTFAKIN